MTLAVIEVGGAELGPFEVVEEHAVNAAWFDWRAELAGPAEDVQPHLGQVADVRFDDGRAGQVLLCGVRASVIHQSMSGGVVGMMDRVQVESNGPEPWWNL